ncbi:hypothetical protein HY386_02900 [Candidatus Daviesbacteria bacterium]|nr:hypothetical protein [Candidatus Daviesbacteria bacterium]
MKIEVLDQPLDSEQDRKYYARVAAVVAGLGDVAISGFDAALSAAHQASNLSLGEFLKRFGDQYDLPPDIVDKLAAVEYSGKSILDGDPANYKNRFTITAP